jgi:hypothetical protein
MAVDLRKSGFSHDTLFLRPFLPTPPRSFLPDGVTSAQKSELETRQLGTVK